MAIVVFDYGTWRLRYPELSHVSQPLAQMYFTEATLFCDNTETSIFKNEAQRAMFLFMVTAHIAALNAAVHGQPASPLVGRINDATEGSVNVATELKVAAGSAQWYAQTKYGISYWQATAQFRTMQYVANPARPVDPFRGFGGYGR